MIPDYPAAEEFSELGQGIKHMLKWVLSPELQAQLFPLKIVFILFGLGFLTMTVYFLLKTSYMDWWFLSFLEDFFFPKFFEKKAIIRKWKKVKKGMKKDFEDHWKLAVIEGANLIDKILKDAGYGGDNLEERLRRVDKEEIVNIDDLKKAQTVFRDVVRDPDYHLTRERAEEIIEIFERSLTDLNIL